MNKAKSAYAWIDREQFVTRRYEKFKKKQELINRVDPENRFFVITDLDKTYGNDSKPMKDCVLCDRCNKDIVDPQFILGYGAYCYHFECVKTELPEIFQNKKNA